MDTLKLLDVWHELVDIKSKIGSIVTNIEEERYETDMDIHDDLNEEYERLHAMTESIHKYFHDKHRQQEDE